MEQITMDILGVRFSYLHMIYHEYVQDFLLFSWQIRKENDDHEINRFQQTYVTQAQCADEYIMRKWYSSYPISFLRDTLIL
jgi:hypothetical protein